MSEGVGRLLVLTGLPGSGKTTLATQLAASLPACRMCPDDWMMASRIDLWDEATRARIEAFQADLSLDLLRAGQNVVIEWSLLAQEERDALPDAGGMLGAHGELHYLTAEVDKLWARDRYRGMNSMNGRGKTNQPTTTSSEPTTATRYTSMIAPRRLTTQCL